MGAKIFYTEFESDFANHYWYCDVADTWEEADLFDASNSTVHHIGVTDLDIPANAVVEIVCRNIRSTEGFRRVGARAVGSSTARILNIHEAEDGGHTNVTMFVQTNTNSAIEVFASEANASSGPRFSIAGYWLGAEYIDLFETFQISTENTWTSQDLNSFGVPSGAIVEIAAVNMSGGYDTVELGISNTVGTRSIGSSSERKLSLHEPEMDIEGNTSEAREYCTMQVKSSGANATIEAYVEHSGVAQFVVLGYWNTAPGNYTDLIVSPADADNTGWLQRNVSGIGIPPESVAEFQLVNEKTNGEVTMGIQGISNSTERKLDLHEPEPSGDHTVRMHVNVDISGNIYIYHGFYTFDHSFTAFGYWDDFNNSLFALEKSAQSDLFIEGLNPNIHYLEFFPDTFTASSAGSWETISVSDIGIPKSTLALPVVAEVVVLNNHTSLKYNGGVRSVGSSLSRRFDIHPAIGFGVDALSMLVPVDDNGDIQIYAENTSSISFRVIGAWRGATYQEKMDSFISSTSLSWSNYDLGSDYEDTIAEIVISNTHTTLAHSGGIRQVGSSFDRYEQITKGSASPDYMTMHVNTDGPDGRIQLYASNSVYVIFTSIGYWVDPPGTYHEAFNASGDVSVSDSWETSNIGVPTNSVVEMVLANQRYNTELYIGIREIGSTNDRRFQLRENDFGVGDSSSDLVRMHSNVTSGTSVELYWDLISRPRTFRTIGYWDNLGKIINTISEETNLYVRGGGIIPSSGDTDLFIEGSIGTPIVDNISLFTLAGIRTDSRELYILGHKELDSNTDRPSGLSLYTTGPLEASGSTPDYITGHGSVDGSISLVMWFPTYDFTLYLEARSASINDTTYLSIRGSPSGIGENIDSIPLFLEAEGSDPPPWTAGGTRSWTLFLNASSGGVENDDNWTLFLHSDTQTVGNIDLYMYAHASGSLPHGPTVTETIDLFVANPADPRRIGYIPRTNGWSLFLDVNQGAFGQVNLFTSGSLAPFTLFSSSGNLFINGSIGPSDQTSLYIFGILGSINNGPFGVPLFLPGATGVYNTRATLYSHGF